MTKLSLHWLHLNDSGLFSASTNLSYSPLHISVIVIVNAGHFGLSVFLMGSVLYTRVYLEQKEIWQG